MFAWKLSKLRALKGVDGGKGKIGIPMGLNMYENIPFWYAFLTRLGFEVVLSDVSSRALYRKGQDTIPSDTVCYPAKLMHGHIVNLLEKGVTRIFYPCMPYNFNEKKGDNHYNCPVVAYYPELLDANMEVLKNISYEHGYFGLHRPKDLRKRRMSISTGSLIFRVTWCIKPQKKRSLFMMLGNGKSDRRASAPSSLPGSTARKSLSWPAGRTILTRRSTTGLIR